MIMIPLAITIQIILAPHHGSLDATSVFSVAHPSLKAEHSDQLVSKIPSASGPHKSNACRSIAIAGMQIDSMIVDNWGDPDNLIN